MASSENMLYFQKGYSMKRKAERKQKVKARDYGDPVYAHIPGELRGFCVPINDVKFWKENPRDNDAASKKLAELIKVHGFTKPIIVWDRNMVTYAGNTALKAAHRLNMEQIPVIKREFTNEDAAIAYGISDNKAGEFSSWDDEQLAHLFKAKDFSGINLGFDKKHVKSLMLSEDLPDALPDIDLQGKIDGKSDFMVLQFNSKDEMNEFIEYMGYPAHQRVLPFNDVKIEKKKRKVKQKERG